jgi:hypothetical protein
LASTERLSLYDEVRSRGYEASIIASYTLDFQFYERVVLRRLQSSGCRHNIVLCDARQCTKALVSGGYAPRLCGTGYSLLPIQMARAFHPKLLLLLGRRKSRLIIGSHNLTLSGFGLNREIASALDVVPHGPSGAIAGRVWNFIRAWTTGFEGQIQSVIAATENIVPWLASTTTAEKEMPLLCSLPSGPSLWDQFKQFLNGAVRSISIISPYFDSKLSFVRALEKELRPEECIIAIQPEFTDVPTVAKSMAERFRFIDISRLGGAWAHNRFHAKVYKFELVDGSCVVVSGSANASERAWRATPSDRNAEVILIHGDGARVWKRLGLARISDLPEVDARGWDVINSRALKNKEKDNGYESPFLAISAPDGFLVDKRFTLGVAAKDIHIFGGVQDRTSIERIEASPEQSLCVCEDQAVRDSATRLQIVEPTGPHRIALVHHIDDLLDKAAGNLRHAFRAAFSGLGGDPDQLTELLKIVEKAIFDEPIMLADASEKPGRQRVAVGQKQEADSEPVSLMISAGETTRARRRQRILVSSDLALIIDALIYQLGRGLHDHIDSEISNLPPDAEPSTPPEEVPPPPQVDGHVLAQLCRRKVNVLFRRMVGQLELAANRAKDATSALIQLTAVLGVVKHLRLQQFGFEWLPRGETLVDPEKQWEFFKRVAQLLYAPHFRIAALGLAEHNSQEFDELTNVRALLAWIALDCELDKREVLQEAFNDPDWTREELIGLGYFLPVISECAIDSFARTILTSIAEQQNGKLPERAAYHLQWAHRLLVAPRRKYAERSQIELGDIVVPLTVKGASPAVVLDAQTGKAGLLDLDDPEKPKQYIKAVLGQIDSLRSNLLMGAPPRFA